MTLLDILTTAFVGIFFIILLFSSIISIHCWLWFHWRTCKHCCHTLKYKGQKEEGDKCLYIFQCPKCGKYEVLSRQELLKALDNGFNPYDN